MVILKFSGTSVGTATSIQNLKNIIGDQEGEMTFNGGSLFIDLIAALKL